MIMMDRLHEAAGIAPALKPHIPGLLRCFDHLGAETLDTQRVHEDFHLGRRCIRRLAGRSSTSRASQPRPSLNDVPPTVSGATSPACCARSTMRRRAYRDPARSMGGSAGPPSCAATPAGSWRADAGMLRAYEADKAIYEVVYETRNRPDWVDIPLRAVAALAADDRASGSDQPPTLAEQPGAESCEPASI